MSESTGVLGAYCNIDGEEVKATITTAHISSTIYRKKALLDYTPKQLDTALDMVIRHRQLPGVMDKSKVQENFHALRELLKEAQVNTMTLINGQKVVTVVVCEPAIEEETQLVELSPHRKAWWTESSPELAMLVNAVAEAQGFPFEPWKAGGDTLISALETVARRPDFSPARLG